MVDVYLLIYSYFIAYASIYIISHIPFDIIMLIKRGSAKYPRPSFTSSFETISVVSITSIFWLVLFIAPILFFSSDMKFLSLQIIPSKIQFPLVVSGIIIMSIGLVVGCLGRIGRGAYLRTDDATLTTKWGHAIVRHPEYFMYITGFIGLPLVALSPYLLILLIGIPGYVITAKNEEELLIESFGEEYIDYMKKVGRFSPKLRKKD